MKRRQLLVLTLILSLLGCVTAEHKAAAPIDEQTTDAWLKTKIITTYALSEHLNPFAINADVKKGVVVLTGTVENDIQRDLATEIAKGVNGAKQVDNKIIVNPQAQHDIERSTFLHYVEDANTTARVKSRLLMDPHTQGLKIQVTTRNGVVTLAGTVASDIEADLACQLVLNTKGVIEVQNHLTIVKQSSIAE